MSARKQTSGKGKRAQEVKAEGQTETPEEDLSQVRERTADSERLAEDQERNREAKLDQAWEEQEEARIQEAYAKQEADALAAINEAGSGEGDPGEEADQGYYCPNCGGPDGCDCGYGGYSGHPV